MVATRSGTKDGRLVRFKKGVSVKRFLNFNSPNSLDEDALEERVDDNLLDDVIVQEKSNGTACHVDDHQATHDIFDSENVHSDTINFDPELSAPTMSSVLWDFFIFALFIVIMYSGAGVCYKMFGHPVYLVFSSLGMIAFLYNVTYFDSVQPGVVPPSPLSPAKIRQHSGHTFHMSYVMTVVLGLIFLLMQTCISDVTAAQT